MVNKERAANIAALNDAFRQQPPRHPPRLRYARPKLPKSC